MIRVIVADDHPVFRRGLAMILAAEPSFQVAGEAANGGELLSLLDRVAANVVCLDINMPGLSGLELIAEVHKRAPRLPVLILSQYPEKQMAVRAIRQGASGYVTKDAEPGVLIGAIRKLAEGKKHFSEEVTELLAEQFQAPMGQPHEALSNREMRVMVMLAGGDSVSGIGEKLNLSVKTVSTYRTRVLEKLKLRSNAELIRYALEHKLIE